MKSFLGIRNRTQGIFFFSFVIIIFLVTLDPFHWITPPPAAPRTKFETQKMANAMAAYRKDSRPAEEMLVGLFEKHPVVLVGEHNLIKEEVEFISAALPALRRSGVNLLGVEFLLAQDQPEIDSLLNGSSFDEKKAKELMFRRLPIWGYQEYLDMMKAAWQLNANKQSGQPEFRIIGLAMNFDFSTVRQQEDIQKPEVMRRILAAGVPDAFMAARVLQILGPANKSANQRILVFIQRKSSFAHWEDAAYQVEMKKYGYPAERRMGVLLHDVLGDSLATVLFYSPVPYQRSPVKEGYPDEGLLDAIKNQVDKESSGGKPIGINLGTSLFGKLDCSQTDWGQFALANKTPVPVLKDLADAVVVFSAIRKLHLVTEIPDFINADNIAAAYKILPASVDPKKTGVADLQESIGKLLVDYRKVLDSFQ